MQVTAANFEEEWGKLKGVKRAAVHTMLSNRGIYITKGEFNHIFGKAGHYHRKALEIQEKFETLEAGRNFKNEVTNDFDLYMVGVIGKPNTFRFYLWSRRTYFPREAVDKVLTRFNLNREEFITSYFHEYLY